MYAKIDKTVVIGCVLAIIAVFGAGFWTGCRYSTGSTDSDVNGTISALKTENSQLRSQLESAAGQVQSAAEKLQSAIGGLDSAQSTVNQLSESVGNSKELLDGSQQLISQSRDDLQSADSILDDVAKSNSISGTQKSSN